MRLAWAVVLGALGAGGLAWWLAREPDGPATDQARPAPHSATARAAKPGERPAAPVLYRWHDDAGVVQVTDIPPKGRDYARVDVGALERRNTFDSTPDAAAK